MATSIEFMEFVCERLSDFENIRYRKMFGEYMLYMNDKPILLICDGTVYVKMPDCVSELMCDCDKGFPYEGAKEHYILDIENSELLAKVIPVLEQATPIPKKKTRRKTKSE